ncbi:MAG: hypothetical protein IJ661_01470 [Lachnospiraceae bacterium]|nr:hypothetical protein [Lachnospiraceae bacterium]
MAVIMPLSLGRYMLSDGHWFCVSCYSRLVDDNIARQLGQAAEEWLRGY